MYAEVVVDVLPIVPLPSMCSSSPSYNSHVLEYMDYEALF